MLTKLRGLSRSYMDKILTWCQVLRFPLQTQCYFEFIAKVGIAKNGSWRFVESSNDVLNDFARHVRQPEAATVVFVSQPFVVHP